MLYLRLRNVSTEYLADLFHDQRTHSAARIA